MTGGDKRLLMLNISLYLGLNPFGIFPYAMNPLWRMHLDHRVRKCRRSRTVSQRRFNFLLSITSTHFLPAQKAGNTAKIGSSRVEIGSK